MSVIYYTTSEHFIVRVDFSSKVNERINASESVKGKIVMGVQDSLMVKKLMLLLIERMHKSG